MIDFDLILQTDRILLRPLISNDYSYFEKLTSDPSMWTYFTHDLSLKSELHEWVEAAVNDIKNKTRLAFTIIDKSSGIPIGSTSFGNISLRDKRIEIGWTWLSKESQGTGINSRVKLLMIRYLFEVSDCERVEFKTDVLNTPARKALLRIGAIEEGVLRSHTLMTLGRRRDTIYYSILKSEWEKR
jgi:RimJ/RimL family protein N-acetyltransferase